MKASDHTDCDCCGVTFDWLCLGTTVPEPDSHGNILICSAGYSPDLNRLVRLYPWTLGEYPRRWHSYRIMAVKTSADNRVESFEPIRAELLPTPRLTSKVRRKQILDQFTVSGIREANERRLSLAMVQPEEMTFRLDENDPLVPYPILHPTLKARERFDFTPRIHASMADGSKAKFQLRDWGTYEWMRKYPGREAEIPAGVHLSDTSSLLIGNFNNHRTAWLAISVINNVR